MCFGFTHLERNIYEICDHRLDGKKIANAIFMPTADEPVTVQSIGHENGESSFHRKKRSEKICHHIVIREMVPLLKRR
jgi:hypothetical protein